jgi:phosphatidylglycerophosphate synthase
MNGGRVGTVHRGPAGGLLASGLVLVALDLTVGLGARGWAVGLLCSAGVALVLAGALVRTRVERFGPADRVTLVRAALACGVAGLVADSSGAVADVPALVGLAGVALLLDGVDGRVARRTGTASRFGAAFDMEVDAFLLLVLSVYVARSAGPWVLLIGAARYALLVAARPLPWLRRPTPPRQWAKVVAATQGVVLVVAAADLLPRAVTDVVLLGALVLLTESFGHQVRWLLRHRGPAPVRLAPAHERAA